MGNNSDKNKFLVTLMHLIMLIVVVFLVVFIINKVEVILEEQKEPELTNIFISEKLETVGELTSAELVYNGLIRYTDGEIPILTKKEFSMLYCAYVEAGFKLSEAEVEVEDTSVTITLPEVEILDIYVDPDSIEFFDEESALFNWTEKEDAIDAIKEAEEDVAEKANIAELKATAKQQTELLLKGLFADTIGERVLIIEYKD